MRRILIVIGVFFSLGTYSQAVALTVWPDTGQNTCYDIYGPITCPQKGQPYYGQDAQYQGLQPSYTKLDANGNALDVSAADWSMVRDNVTGFVWEVKTDDETIHDRDNRYDWCNSALENPGDCDSENNTESFINVLNSAKFGNYADWRIPSVFELATLLNSDTREPAINTTFFPNTIERSYWSSTGEAGHSGNVWCVGFDDGGGVSSTSKTLFERSVRAVRGGNSGSLNKYIDNHDGTVTDKDTGLMWQKSSSYEVNGVSGLDYISWEEALEYIAGLNTIGFAGHSDWRMPNRNELQSLVDYSRTDPAINIYFFPDSIHYDHWWSSTTVYGVNERTWTINFYDGRTDDWTKTNGGHIRAVRAGKKQTFNLFVMVTGNGGGVVTSTPAGISCGTDCGEMYESGTIVSLTATADSDSVFKGWAGACTSIGTCTVTMNQSKSVTANFINPSLTNQGVLMLLLND